VSTKSLETEATRIKTKDTRHKTQDKIRGEGGILWRKSRETLQPTSYSLRLKFVIGVKYVIIWGSE